MGRLAIQLVDTEAPAPSKGIPKKYSFLLQLFVTIFVAGFFFGLGHALWPKKPTTLTPKEAAAILQMQKGFAGYSLIKDGPEGSSLGHSMFCPSCGNEIATVYVNFLPPAEPLPGSRLALMTNLAHAAIAKAETKPKTREVTKPEPVASLIEK